VHEGDRESDEVRVVAVVANKSVSVKCLKTIDKMQCEEETL
jgi:hypothetical protein